MNINRYNYEEFFLLYVDNELTQEQRMEVEAFVQGNPDLEEELVMLKQSSLKPDRAIQFPGKSLLMKPEAAGLVNETNYEEFFLLYVDDELETVLRREVEQFASAKPQYQTELDLLLQTKMEPQAVIFPDKSLLYREAEEDRKPVVIMWWRVAAVAAMLLLALGIFWLTNNKTASTTQPELVVNDKQNTQPGVTNQTAETINKEEAQQQQEEIQTQDNRQIARDEPVTNQQLVTSNKTDKKNNIAVKDNEPVTDQQKQYAYKEPKADAADETQVPLKETTIAATSYSRSISTGMTQANLNHGVRVETAAFKPKQIEDEETLVPEQDGLYFANTTVDRKNKLRGFFRKVSRAFEKTTNLPEERGGILIGNFEIALK